MVLIVDASEPAVIVRGVLGIVWRSMLAWGVLTTILSVLILVWPGRTGAAWPPATTNSPSPTGQLQS